MRKAKVSKARSGRTYVRRVSYTRSSRPSVTYDRPADVGRRLTTRAPIIRGGPWTEPTFADSTVGDNPDGEDLDVRRAAVAALGSYNGSVVV
ncbi:MAG TPA: hypothetical protein VG672_26185, partial [Bryobacteraceae bacterium]|nr:hypothetical protein [Bryobacteraceae bacterium]